MTAQAAHTIQRVIARKLAKRSAMRFMSSLLGKKQAQGSIAAILDSRRSIKNSCWSYPWQKVHQGEPAMRVVLQGAHQGSLRVDYQQHRFRAVLALDEVVI